ERVFLGPVHPVRLTDVKERLSDTGGLGSGGPSGERYDAKARGLVGNDETLFGVSLHSQSSLLPPHRHLEFLTPPVDSLRNPEGRPKLSLAARGGGRIHPEFADPVVQVLLAQKVLLVTIPISDRQEGVEADQSVGLAPRTPFPHTFAGECVRDRPEGGPAQVLVERETAFDAEGRDRLRPFQHPKGYGGVGGGVGLHL